MGPLPVQPVDPFAGSFESDRDVMAERRARLLLRAVRIMTAMGAVVVVACVYDCECAGWYASPLFVLPGLCSAVAWWALPYAPGKGPPPKERRTVRAVQRGIVAAVLVGLPWTIFATAHCTPEHVERCLLD